MKGLAGRLNSSLLNGKTGGVMNRDEVFEVEQLLQEIGRLKSTKQHVTRIQELMQPIFDNEREKAERDKHNLSTSYMNFNVKKEVSKAINALSSTKTMFSLASEDLKRLHGVEQDILHALELTDLSLEELTALTVELKEVRIMRRITKNFLEVANPLNDFAVHNEKLIKQLHQIAGTIQKSLSSIDNRKYSVREKTTLQDAFDSASPLVTRIK